MNSSKSIINGENHIYIHVPFCDGKCNYCSFYSIKKTYSDVKIYLDTLELEIAKRTHDKIICPTTIYVGGGSPSLLEPNELKCFFEIIKKHFNLKNLKEWTFEVNPASLSYEKLLLMRNHGVNRISIGIQSFSDENLSKLGRRYRAIDADRAISMVQKASIKNFNIDLISAIPGTSDKEWEKELETALAYNPCHMSIYTLTIEEGTSLQKMVGNNKWRKENDITETKRIDTAEKILYRNGFYRYEISNYSCKGYVCLHNFAFWEGNDYIGFGPSALSRIGNARFINPSSLILWNQKVQNSSFYSEVEILSNSKNFAERIAFAFRLLRKPVNPYFFISNDDPNIRLWNRTINELKSEKLIREEKNGFILTKRGAKFADHVAAAFINNAE